MAELPDPEEELLEEEAATEAEFSEEEAEPAEDEGIGDPSQAVLWASDWTSETILAQLGRGNIELSPRFQRRDAWSRTSKSRFIESLILGLPIPQIVLAERNDKRGQYIVLDGKQRLLSLLHFYGQGEGRDVAFKLSGLEVRKDLSRVNYDRLAKKPDLQNEFNTFSSQTIRAVVIRNWPTTSFLHLVFRRLNTGSLKLSPQELRQAITPGDFSNFVDDFSLDSTSIHQLLSRTTPDPRMRDVELLARHISFQLRMPEYRGRMKEFLDESAIVLNAHWQDREPAVRQAADQFVAGIDALVEIFGQDKIARKDKSRLFNRAIFDALIFYACNEPIRQAMLANAEAVRDAYIALIVDPNFQKAVESDTAGVPNTAARLNLWGTALAAAIGMQLAIPTQQDNQIVVA
jgi:hypothetical protein